VKTIILTAALILSATALPALENDGKLYDCETFKPWGHPKGWGFWSDKNSRKPEWKISADAAEGKQALQIAFHGCHAFQGVSIDLNRMPEDADCLTFWVKVISGKPPSNLQLIEKSKNGMGKEFFGSPFALPEPGEKDHCSAFLVPLHPAEQLFRKQPESRCRSWLHITSDRLHQRQRNSAH